MAATPPSYNLAQRGHSDQVQFGKDGFLLRAAGGEFLDQNSDASAFVQHSGLPATSVNHYVTLGQLQPVQSLGATVANATNGATTVVNQMTASFASPTGFVSIKFNGTVQIGLPGGQAGANAFVQFRFHQDGAPVGTVRRAGAQKASFVVLGLTIGPSSFDQTVHMEQLIDAGDTAMHTYDLRWIGTISGGASVSSPATERSFTVGLGIPAI